MNSFFLLKRNIEKNSWRKRKSIAKITSTIQYYEQIKICNKNEEKKNPSPLSVNQFVDAYTRLGTCICLRLTWLKKAVVKTKCTKKKQFMVKMLNPNQFSTRWKPIFFYIFVQCSFVFSFFTFLNSVAPLLDCFFSSISLFCVVNNKMIDENHHCVKRNL